MDLHGFNALTLPNYYAPLPRMGADYKSAQRVTVNRSTYPAPDDRYLAYAGPMADGRLITDYRPHCSRNVAPARQFTTKLWMIHHTDSIIELSRARQSEQTGASLPFARTRPPPADIAKQTPFSNEIYATGIAGGIGVERGGQDCPQLFGTYVIPPTSAELADNVKRISLTTRCEGGRNTIRGGALGFEWGDVPPRIVASDYKCGGVPLWQSGTDGTEAGRERAR